MNYFKFYKYLVIGIAIFVLAGLVMAFVRRIGNGSGTKIDLSRASVVKEIQALNRLETASYSIEKIVEAGQPGDPFSNLLFGNRILLIAHGKVIAGIDLADIDEQDLMIRGKNLALTLPAPVIISSTLDNEKTRVYDRTQGILTQGDKDLESQARQAAESSIRQAACEAGILQDARENATERVEQLFMFAGFEEVTVNIPEGSC